MNGAGDQIACQHEDHFPDMYPEFAPEPIVVRCENPAAVVMRIEGATIDGSDFRDLVCTEHAGVLLTQAIDEGCEFTARSLTDADVREWNWGWNAGQMRPVTDQQWLVASYEGWVEAKLIREDPEQSECWVIGWEAAMAKRLSEWEGVNR